MMQLYRQPRILRKASVSTTPSMLPYGVLARSKMMRLGVIFLLLVFALTTPTAARAEVFHSKESALRLAFPGADTVDKREIFLSGEQVEEVERLARVQVPSRLVTIYVGLENESPLGYAFIETHQVRTLPETILIVIDPGGRVRDIYMLAFHEPPEYGPSERWLGQFQGRPLTDDLSLRGDLAGIAGATLTATAITAAVRKTLATFRVAVVSTKVDPGAPEEMSDSKSKVAPREAKPK
jgi:hypothetical protein